MKGNEPKGGGASFLAHVGAKYAVENNKGAEYHHAVFAAHWQEEKDIAAVEELAAIATRLGLDEAEFRAALENPRYAAQVREEAEWAHRHGISGVPAIIFGNRYLVSGAQPVEVLRQVAERCVAEGLVVE
jgi:predicted DsbA family dithiol-disulfide isomerase